MRNEWVTAGAGTAPDFEVIFARPRGNRVGARGRPRQGLFTT